MKVYIAILFAFFTSLANATETTLILHGVSEHGKSARVWQEHNYGIGIRRSITDDFSYQVGAYQNSYDKQTVYAIIQYIPIGNEKVQVGVFGGVATGYDLPVVGGLMLNLHHDKSVITVRHVTKISANTVSVTTVEVGFKF